MKKSALLVLFLILSGCLEVENSSSSDSGGLTFDPNATPEFIAANAVFVKNCSTSGCHTQNFATLTEDEFIASPRGWVIPGDAANSPVYFRNVGSSGARGPKNMPQTPRPALSVQELQAIEDWINSITP